MLDLRTFLNRRERLPLPKGFDVAAWCAKKHDTRDYLRLVDSLRRLERKNVVREHVLPRARRLAARGASQAKIARLLNSRGFVTVTAHAWTQGAVSLLLSAD